MKLLLTFLIFGFTLARADITNGLALKFTCDAFSDKGTKLPDVSGNELHGHITGARAAPSGRLGGGCDFTGKESFVAVPASPLLDTPHVTVCLWLKTAKADAPDRTLVDKNSDGGYALRLASGDKASARRGKVYAVVAGRDCYSDASVADNAWHHASFSYDGTTLKLYVDGALQKQTVTLKGALGAAGTAVTLGMNRTNPSAREKDVSYEGSVDEILVFNRALSDKEIVDVIASTKPKFTKQQVARRIKEIEELYERGLLTKEFYERKLAECEVNP